MAERTDLYPAEHVLWTGAPTRVAVFEPADRFLVPFYALWLGVIVFLMLGKSLAAGPVGLVFAVLFLSVGLYLLVGRLIVRGLAVRGSTYTVTNQRLIVHMRLFGRSHEFTEYLRVLPPPVLQERSDGTGTIRFGTSGARAQIREQGQTQRLTLPDPRLLHAVPHARQVRDLIVEAQRVAAAP